MASLSGEARARYVQEMFARIAPSYDLMNRLVTAGPARRGRREILRRAQQVGRGAAREKRKN